MRERGGAASRLNRCQSCRWSRGRGTSSILSIDPRRQRQRSWWRRFVGLRHDDTSLAHAVFHVE